MAEIRTTVNGVLHDSILTEDVKRYPKQEAYKFVKGQTVTFKRLNKQCEVLQCIEQEQTLRGSLTSPSRYLVKGDFGRMLVNENELTK
jgi:hypothetical protein